MFITMAQLSNNRASSVVIIALCIIAGVLTLDRLRSNQSLFDPIPNPVGNIAASKSVQLPPQQPQQAVAVAQKPTQPEKSHCLMWTKLAETVRACIKTELEKIRANEIWNKLYAVGQTCGVNAIHNLLNPTKITTAFAVSRISQLNGLANIMSLLV